MPGKLATTRAALTPHRSAPNTPPSRGRPSAAVEPGAVQDRIRQWQTQGAEFAAAPDALSVNSEPPSEAEYHFNHSEVAFYDDAHISVGDEARKDKRRPKNKEGERSRVTATKKRSSSTPRKRVISDNHWKAVEPETRSSPLGPRKNLDREDGRRRRRASSPAVEPERNSIYPTKSLRELDLTSHRRERKAKDQRPESTVEEIEQSIPSYLNPEVREFWEHGNTSDESKRRSKYAETLGQPSLSGYEDTNSVSLSKTGRIFKKTKEIFTKAEAPPILGGMLPSIEAWLEEQPDPFVDNPDPDMLPKRLSIRQKNDRNPPQSDTLDADTPWRIPAHASVRPQQDSNETAMKERRKPRPLREKTEYNQTTHATETRRDSEIQADNITGEGLKTRSGDSSKPSHRQRRRDNSQKYPTREVEPRSTDRPAVLSQREASHEVQKSLELQKLVADKPSEIEHCGIKRKLTTHEDLISVLSRPGRSKTNRSVRRRAKNIDHGVESSEILKMLLEDETKYIQELQTLVDGVIPVLLQSVLSKSKSRAAAGMFGTSANASDDLNFAKPIIDMGVALERLRSCHARIPTASLDSLISWGQTSQKVYSDYLSAWKLGFQDIVVNLAPLTDGTTEPGMARDGQGDIVDSSGRKADVAYLLKRPLVRVKNLGKIFERVDCVIDTSRSHKVAEAYNDLTALARQRFQDELGRLEDETAAGVDTSRARELRTLAPVTQIKVDENRRVKARDCFGLSLYHSSAQRIDCRVEIILRDDTNTIPPEGDVLICEVEETSKWLLFPPVDTKNVSARKGDKSTDLVVMIRGVKAGQDWHELLEFQADDEATVKDWMKWFGSNPLPPRLTRTRDYVDTEVAAPVDLALLNSMSSKAVVPLNQLVRPIGASSDSSTALRRSPPKPETYLPQLNLGGALQSKQQRRGQNLPRDASAPLQSSSATMSSGRSTASFPSVITTSSSGSTSTYDQHASPGLRRANAAKKYENGQRSPERLHSGQTDLPPTDLSMPRVRSDAPKSPLKQSPDSAKGWSGRARAPTEDVAAPMSLSTPQASVPSSPISPTGGHERLDRGAKRQSMTLNESVYEQWNKLSTATQTQSAPQTPNKRSRDRKSRQMLPFTEDVPPVPVHSQRPRDVTPRVGTHRPEKGSPPAPPPHTAPAAQRASSGPSALHGPISLGSPGPAQKVRRSSSPLKREYAPSTASNSPDDSDSDGISDVSSDTSEEFGSEADDKVTPLVPLAAGGARRHFTPTNVPPAQGPGSRAQTLAPSDSASQGPYRSVPPTSQDPATQKTKAIAMVCSWSDSRGWDQLHPDECSIVISPGLIETFEMSAAHSTAIAGQSSTSSQPLVAFEMTPLVMLHRGAAIDVSFRSPPTANSRVKPRGNVMFRCRSPAECERLYGLINWARMNNPTYIALERARPKIQPKVTFANDPQSRGQSASGASWYKFGGSSKRSSYRASSGQGPKALSAGGVSDASAMSMASSFLKKFSANSPFNLNKSAMVRKEPSQSGVSSLSSSNSQGLASSSSSTAPSQRGHIPSKDGPNVPATSAEAANGGGMVNNMKARLYLRENITNWADLGAVRVTILPPQSNAADRGPGHLPLGPPNPRQSSARMPSAAHTPHRIHNDGREKRVVICKNKNPEVVYIDRVLGESCFERIAQCGIAINVWVEDDTIAKTGGVVGGRNKTYMLQLPGAKEAAWVFGIVGTYRYGGAPGEG